MRHAWAVETILTVLLAFVGAPFLHLHVAEQHEHGGGPAHSHQAVVHAHFPDWFPALNSADQHDPGLSHAEHEAKPLEFLANISRGASVLTLNFLHAERSGALPSVELFPGMILPFAPRTHDPPPLDLSGPRAPPA
jgi:hypothetical protein